MKITLKNAIWYLTPVWLGSLIYNLTGYVMIAYFEGENSDKLVDLGFTRKNV